MQIFLHTNNNHREADNELGLKVIRIKSDSVIICCAVSKVRKLGIWVMEMLLRGSKFNWY